jgi:hypothetical protein
VRFLPCVPVLSPRRRRAISDFPTVSDPLRGRFFLFVCFLAPRWLCNDLQATLQFSAGLAFGKVVDYWILFRASSERVLCCAIGLRGTRGRRYSVAMAEILSAEWHVTQTQLLRRRNYFPIQGRNQSVSVVPFLWRAVNVFFSLEREKAPKHHTGSHKTR